MKSKKSARAMRVFVGGRVDVMWYFPFAVTSSWCVFGTYGPTRVLFAGPSRARRTQYRYPCSLGTAPQAA